MSYQEAVAVIARLADAYPQAFAVYEKRRRPLKLGVRENLVTAGMDLQEIRLALSVYCRSYGYLRNMRAGATRVALNGEPAGIVTTEEAARSAEELRKRGAKLREQKEAAAATRRQLAFSNLKAAAMARRQKEAAYEPA